MAIKLMPYKISVHGISDIGLVRQNNEDSWTQLPEEYLYVLADGMGGHNAGEVASWKCVDYLCKLFHEKFDATLSLAATKKMLYELIQEVNKAVYDLGHQIPKFKGMGTTLCCLLLHPEGMIYGHVGDSRIYRYRDGKLEQLTHDHSLLRELIDLGQISEQQADDFTYKNIITKAIGTENSIDPSVDSTSVRHGDMFLMCTDGLSDLLLPEEIESVLKTASEARALEELILRAKQKGGYDNITAVLAKIQEKYEEPLS